MFTFQLPSASILATILIIPTHYGLCTHLMSSSCPDVHYYAWTLPTHSTHAFSLKSIEVQSQCGSDIVQCVCSNKNDDKHCVSGHYLPVIHYQSLLVIYPSIVTFLGNCHRSLATIGRSVRGSNESHISSIDGRLISSIVLAIAT